MNEIFKKIEKQLKENNIIIYIKGTPEMPLCGFTAQTIHILNLSGIKYKYVNILENQDIRKALPEYSGWPTFPQVYYKEKLIGGADIILDLYNNKKLNKILGKK